MEVYKDSRRGEHLPSSLDLESALVGGYEKAVTAHV